VITVDHWLGSKEHQAGGYAGEVADKLPALYDTFLTNCWDYRDKILPLRMTTKEGMEIVRTAGVIHDLVFIDADHSYESVYSDIEEAFKFGKRTIIAGDDWYFDGVQRAATDFANSRGFEIHYYSDLWIMHYGA
jgi:hypothetical protein